MPQPPAPAPVLELPPGDTPRPDDADRYAIYAVNGDRRRLCETSLDGIGLALRTMREEEEFGEDDAVGILDRRTRVWLVNPWAKGRRSR